MRNKRKERAFALVETYLKYLRLREDLAAIEREIAGSQPLTASEEGGLFKRTISSLKTNVQNELRKMTLQELTAQKKEAVEAIARFEGRLDVKTLTALENPEKIKALMEKKLFQGDTYGLERAGFALTFILEDTTAYQREAESLRAASKFLFDDETRMEALYKSFCGNFKALQTGTEEDLMSAFLELGGAASSMIFSLLPFGVTGVFALLEYGKKQKRVKAALSTLSTSEAHTMFAMKLTLIGEAKGNVREEEWKKMLDNFLRLVDNLRADAEYERFVEQMDAPLCKEKVEFCDLCLARLSKIVGV